MFLHQIGYFWAFLLLIFQVESISSLSGSKGVQSLDPANNPQSFKVPSNDQTSWQDYKMTQNKRYSSSTEQTYRMLVFNDNLNKINANNSQKTNLGGRFTISSSNYFSLKMNKFGDLSQREFRQIYCNTYPSSESVRLKAQLDIKKQKQKERNCSCDSNQFLINGNRTQVQYEAMLEKDIQAIIVRSNNAKLESPDLRATFTQFGNFTNTQNNSTNKSSTNFTSNVAIQDNITRALQQVNISTNNQVVQVDWTSHAGSIRFQGLCGCCYTFASTDTLAAINSIYRFGFFVSLSKQQIIDCPNNGLTFGCEGGFLQGAYSYIQYSGITTQFAYPYKTKKQNCSLNSGAFKISSFKALNPTCTSLVSQLKLKPVSIGIAGYRLQFYSQGIFDDCNTYIDHAVVLIGYKSGVGWKIKNSWGKDWGMQGYAWIKDGNNCGICSNAVSPTISQQNNK